MFGTYTYLYSPVSYADNPEKRFPDYFKKRLLQSVALVVALFVAGSLGVFAG